MRALVIMDPIEAVNVDKDTTFGFMLAAQARGHTLYYCHPRQLYTLGGQAYAMAAPIQVWHRPEAFYQLGEAAPHALCDFHSVWMRKDPPVDRAFLHATWLLDRANTQVLNAPSGLRAANEKLYMLQFEAHIPETRVTQDAAAILRWLDARGAPLIVKPLDGHGGFGIFKLTPGDPNNPSILEVLTQGGQWVMAQAYLEAAREGDKRIILLDGVPLGAILRVPQAGENRGNIHVGGRVVQTTLSAAERAICAAVAPKLKADGLIFVGLDVIGERLTEINVTSPTGIREILALDGVDIADAYIRWIESQI
ncbi:glutathione synthase [Myxococcota bacterium]|nr:glutathione synthase [Myxococcota bacterium]MBU1431547.1 glutathione synthase [Myxococcota bacterium]MBU1896589.1 glutathione synthase [Myxococcota bacterium]